MDPGTATPAAAGLAPLQPQAALTPEQLFALYDDAPPAYVRGGFVMAADGAVVSGGSSRPLSGPADLAALRALRAVADVVLVGAGTARAEGYRPVGLRPDAAAWRAGGGRSPVPPLAVVSGRLDLDPSARMFGGRARTLVLTCGAAHSARRAALSAVAEVLVVGEDRVDLPAALLALRERGLSRVLCEGGPRLLAGLVAGDLLDELCVTVSPLLGGLGPPMLPAPLPTPVPLTLRHALAAGGVLALRYTRPSAGGPG